MHKILVVARREFLAAVKTKTFLISLLIMPIMMGGSIIVQVLLKDYQDTKDRRYAAIDRTPDGGVLPVIQKGIDGYNEKAIYDPESGKQVQPKFVIEVVQLDDDSPSSVDRMRETLSERVRKGGLSGFLEVGRLVDQVPSPAAASVSNPDDLVLRYQSNRITQQEFRRIAEAAVNEAMQSRRGQVIGLSDAKRRELLQPVRLVSKGLSRRNAAGQLEDTTEQSLLAALFVPAGMMMLMFMVVMMVANPLLQGVIEEKMQRIAEVLLGSVRPFELMLGKLLGMTAVSLTISGVYLAGGYWAAYRYGFGEYLPLELVVWFVIYQSLAGLLFGSLFIAIGAACTDMKEAQNLLMPVMLLVCLPLFMLGMLMKEPNSPAVTGLSFFPFATPMLMIARQSSPPGVPLWQPLVGIVGVLATTMLCVWAAGRIFRVGLLMQGKGARLSEMMRWVFRG
jgi:ABC-2 type transport system permease protein